MNEFFTSLKTNCLVLRCVHLGDFNVGSKTLSRGKKQRRYRKNRKRRAIAVARELSAAPLLADVPVLVVRAEQTPQFQGHQGNPPGNSPGRTQQPAKHSEARNSKSGRHVLEFNGRCEPASKTLQISRFNNSGKF